MNTSVHSGSPPGPQQDGFLVEFGDRRVSAAKGAARDRGGSHRQSAREGLGGLLLLGGPTCREGELHLLTHNLQGNEVVLLIEAAIIQQQGVPLPGGKPVGPSRGTSQNERPLLGRSAGGGCRRKRLPRRDTPSQQRPRAGGHSQGRLWSPGTHFSHQQLTAHKTCLAMFFSGNGKPDCTEESGFHGL